jgi:hypothetical protein
MSEPTGNWPADDPEVIRLTKLARTALRFVNGSTIRNVCQERLQWLDLAKTAS